VTPTTRPPSGGQIDTLPNTGIEDDETGTGWLGAAALGAAGAYFAGRKLREEDSEPATVDD
jgi:LPXTG-motif cell wall-anchored protein